MKPLNIAIVGAGIGGLAAAALLRRAGHEVQVYEQAGRFARVGAGIQMAPNAMKVLRLLGVEDRLCSHAFQADFAISREWDSGRETSRLPLGEGVARQFGAPYLFLHRADLHAAIADIVPPQIVHLGMKLAAVDQTRDSARLRFVDGSDEPAAQSCTHDSMSGSPSGRPTAAKSSSCGTVPPVRRRMRARMIARA